ncbi:MAG: guanylate kinase [Bacteroidales bacterium]|jgi:guanylate kinase|nr:guanylate kinase [Bacteroidales bacterium]
MKIPKVLIFSAPSGAGKTTVVKHLLQQKKFNLDFSISATSRTKRENEVNSKDYYFLSAEEFKSNINAGEFLEWEEVYPDCFYGSLKSEVERLFSEGKNVVFDVDVKGGINIKDYYKDRALSVFIMPPSVDELENRLKLRSTDHKDAIKMRIEKAIYEISFADKFDVVIINDDLDKTLKETESIVETFLRSEH